MNRNQYIKRLKSFTHIYEEDLDILKSDCENLSIQYEVDSGYIYFENIDLSHAIEIKED